ncbi:hypothetical protein [Priestia aryabhattai]|uniref:hypothetical protein n=1 Tax=Priestia aryabhattai TaxID=412384 RepID=UPI003D2E2D98
MISLPFKARIDRTQNLDLLKEEAAIMHRIADQLSPMSLEFIEYTERIQYVYERMHTIVHHPTKKLA